MWEPKAEPPYASAKILYVKQAGVVKLEPRRIATMVHFQDFSENNLEDLGFISAGRGWNVFRIA